MPDVDSSPATAGPEPGPDNPNGGEKMTNFEQAGLGKSPFRLLGINDLGRASGTCSYCGHPIRYEYRILSADGRKSTIGSECIRSDWQPWAREAKTQLAAMKRAAKSKQIWKCAEHACQTVRERGQRYNTQPHPNEYFAAQGRTYHDYLIYMLEHPNCYADTTIKTLITKVENDLGHAE